MDSIPVRRPINERLSPISRQIWTSKYQLTRPDGTPVDQSVEDTWERVASSLAAVETEPEIWKPRFYEALEDFKFLPAGRIIAGAGTGRRVTLFNCFVMGTINDSLHSIFEHLGEAALTMQQGGGIGYDFSTLRPRGSPVRGVDADASGPLSFMTVWDSMCRTIMSAGSRRGAMMATMRCDHPDIEGFVTAKSQANQLRNFNLSVLMTDPFMDAVAADAPWDLVFEGVTHRTISARALWKTIMEQTYAHAEPGVLFIDRINERNNLAYCETIRATNPCGEQPLPPYGACLLGSLNLAAFVTDPFSVGAHVNWLRLEDTVRIAVRMLDNAIDASGFALAAQEQEAKAKRRIGLGITGLADALMMVGLRYGSEEAADQAAFWMSVIHREAYLASADLAVEKGPFPLYDPALYPASGTVRDLDTEIRNEIQAKGIRNALLTSIAPTGTISLLADNISSGIEPVFAHSFIRTVLESDGSKREETVEDHAIRRYREMFGADAELPPHFVTVSNLTPAEHIRMQAAVQSYVDAAISKTVNVPADISFEDFGNVYLDAYNSGCKGCTTFRPNETTGSILKTAEPVNVVTTTPAAPALANRPQALDGRTYKLPWSDHAFYITINDHEVDGVRRPFEIFANSKNLEHFAWVVALTRMVSAVFRRGGDIAFVVEELKAIFDPRGGLWQQGRYIPSLPAAIGGVIERHLTDLELIAPQEPIVAVKTTASQGATGDFCRKCGQPGLVHEAGCLTCRSCGYSRCE